MFINRGIDKEDMVNIYIMEYYSAIKKNCIMPLAATWMDLEIVMLSEVRQTEKQKHYMTHYMQNLKRHETNELIYKKETD